MTTSSIETYIPLYRKYRPQSFADVVGQTAIIQTLSHAIEQNKVAHAYLLCGPRGTGKTSTARIFAKSLNCENGPTLTPCQTCASCAGITSGNAIDVIEFDAASNNGVDDARELVESVQFSSMSGKFKIYIIDEVHMLSTQAFNALLKTLEEPPPNVIFVFATTEAHKVLPTIISRCQRFDFSRIQTQEIAAHLGDLAKQEGILISDDGLTLIARHARGGLRDAVGLLDQVGVLGRSQPGVELQPSDVAMFIGSLEEDNLFALTTAIGSRQAEGLLSLLPDLINRGIEASTIVKELTQHYRNMLLVKASGNDVQPEALDMNEAYVTRLQEQATVYGLEELPQILSRLSSLEKTIRATKQPELWLEIGLLELTFRENIHQLESLVQRIDALEARLSGGAVPAAMPAPQPVASQPQPMQPALQPMAPPAAAPVSQPLPNKAPEAFQPKESPPVQQTPVAPTPTPPASGGGEYRNLIDSVASPLVKSMLKEHTFLLTKDGTKIVIGCKSEPILTTLKKPERFIHLQKAANFMYADNMVIEVVHEPNPPAGTFAPVTPKQAPKPTVAPPPVSPAPASAVSNQVSMAQPPPQQVSQQAPIPETAVPEFAAPTPEPVLTATTAVMERAPEPTQSVPPPQPITQPTQPMVQPVSQTTGEPPDMDDAKQYTADLLQGQVVD